MTGYKKLLDQVEEGSLANKELNNAKFEMMRNVNGASAIRENLANRIRLGTLTPEQVGRSSSGRATGSSTRWTSGTAPPTPRCPPSSVEDFMKQRLDSRVAEMRADADGASVEDAPFDLRWIRSQMETGSTESANRRDNNRVGSLDEYEQLVTEMTSILHTVEALRDPKNRASLRPDQILDLENFARRLEMDFMQARNFLADQANAGQRHRRAGRGAARAARQVRGGRPARRRPQLDVRDDDEGQPGRVGLQGGTRRGKPGHQGGRGLPGGRPRPAHRVAEPVPAPQPLPGDRQAGAGPDRRQQRHHPRRDARDPPRPRLREVRGVQRGAGSARHRRHDPRPRHRPARGHRRPVRPGRVAGRPGDRPRPGLRRPARG